MVSTAFFFFFLFYSLPSSHSFRCRSPVDSPRTRFLPFSLFFRYVDRLEISHIPRFFFPVFHMISDPTQRGPMSLDKFLFPRSFLLSPSFFRLFFCSMITLDSLHQACRLFFLPLPSLAQVPNARPLLSKSVFPGRVIFFSPFSLALFPRIPAPLDPKISDPPRSSNCFLQL